MGATRLEERFRETGDRTEHIEDEALAFAALASSAFFSSRSLFNSSMFSLETNKGHTSLAARRKENLRNTTHHNHTNI